ncbi:hypothetical protein G7066_14920 [Leucobacter coleopterorum]|uniref:DNA methylase adenine-specific domain-containing protein n=1 Tax=Leucobacter coleopterorum TaxID=2714933 RepID=A0ABX6K324_9MICO|nr:hypothetical protein [Leucobacter coleopterorum]QIM19544.1 hypothetical protein G7066_14920 [Leucobacter coleopterorum]
MSTSVKQDEPTQTITMQGIADLTRVRRPVISMWRSRYADTQYPFPAPISIEESGAQRFLVAEVNRWLIDTGRGNNPEAAIESPLYGDLVERLDDDLDRVSQLLLLQHLHGSSLMDLTPLDVIGISEVHEMGALIDVAEMTDALEDPSLVDAVESLSEAAFGGAAALVRLSNLLVSRSPGLSNEALTSEAEAFLGLILSEICSDFGGEIVPRGEGGLVLANLVAPHLSESHRVVFVLDSSDELSLEMRILWRSLAASHAVVVSDEKQGHSPPRLHLTMMQQAHSESTFFEWLEELLLGMAPADQLLVVGPEPLMLGSAAALPRRQLLAPAPDFREPLRYAASLPKGLSRFGGRRRLALWGFATPSARLTVVADHSCAEFDEAGLIAADLAAALSGDDSVKAHAFLRSSARVSHTALLGDQLSASPARPPVLGGERLARIWELDEGQMGEGAFDTVEVAQHPSPVRWNSYAQVTAARGRDLSGFKIPVAAVGEYGPGKAPVIGVAELQDSTRIGSRGVDRFEIEQVAPHATFTEPGDVVYVERRGSLEHNAAWVDELGGHLVLAPARVFRCAMRQTDSVEHVLTPAVVAEDIRAAASSERRNWLFRTVSLKNAEIIEEFERRCGSRRRELQVQLETVAALHRELVNGFADGVLARADPD